MQWTIWHLYTKGQLPGVAGMEGPWGALLSWTWVEGWTANPSIREGGRGLQVREPWDFPGGPMVLASNAGDLSSIPGQGTKIPHVARCSQKKKKVRVPRRQLAKQAHGSGENQGLEPSTWEWSGPEGARKAEVTVWGREKGEMESLGENHLGLQEVPVEGEGRVKQFRDWKLESQMGCREASVGFEVEASRGNILN